MDKGERERMDASVDKKDGNSKDDKRVVTVCPGDRHLAILDEDGDVFVIGDNSVDQLGIAEDKVFELVRLFFRKRKMKVRTMSSGSNHCLFVTRKGKVFVCGDNSRGQLGLGTVLKGKSSKLVENKRFRKMGRVKHLFARNDSSYFVVEGKDEKSSSLFGVGENFLGKEKREFGVLKEIEIPGIDNESVVSVECGKGHTVILSSGNRVFSVGSNKFGALGLGDRVSRKVPSVISFSDKKKDDDTMIVQICCGITSSLFVDEKGRCYKTGDSITLSPKLLKEIAHVKIREIKVGRSRKYTDFFCFVSKDNQFYLQGDNSDFELGFGHRKPVKVPTLLLENHGFCSFVGGNCCSFFITKDNTCFSVGSNLDSRGGFYKIESKFNETLTYIPGLESDQIVELLELKKVVNDALINYYFTRFMFKELENQAKVLTVFKGFRNAIKNLLVRHKKENLRDSEKFKLCELWSQSIVNLHRQFGSIKFLANLINGKGELFVYTGFFPFRKKCLVYEGEFKLGQLHGKGKLYDNSGILKYRGLFESNLVIFYYLDSLKDRYLVEKKIDVEDKNIFSIIEQIGSGSFGSVYKVLHIPSGEVMALKRFAGESTQNIEKEIIRTFSMNHRNVMKPYFWSTELGREGIVLELCDYSVYDFLMKNKKRLGLRRKLDILIGTVEGMVYLHKIGLVHRDLNWKNVMMRDSTVKIIDFGVSRELNAMKNSTLVTAFRGTPFFIAPEVIDIGKETKEANKMFTEDKYNEKCDVFSFGIMMYQLLFEKEDCDLDSLFYNRGELHSYMMNPENVPTLLKDPNCAPKVDPKWITVENKVLIQIMKRCYDHNPKKRQSFDEILGDLKMVEGILLSEKHILSEITRRNNGITNNFKNFDLKFSNESRNNVVSHEGVMFNLKFLPGVENDSFGIEVNKNGGSVGEGGVIVVSFRIEIEKNDKEGIPRVRRTLNYNPLKAGDKILAYRILQNFPIKKKNLKVKFGVDIHKFFRQKIWKRIDKVVTSIKRVVVDDQTKFRVELKENSFDVFFDQKEALHREIFLNKMHWTLMVVKTPEKTFSIFLSNSRKEVVVVLNMKCVVNKKSVDLEDLVFKRMKPVKLMEVKDVELLDFSLSSTIKKLVSLSKYDKERNEKVLNEFKSKYLGKRKSIVVTSSIASNSVTLGFEHFGIKFIFRYIQNQVRGSAFYVSHEIIGWVIDCQYSLTIVNGDNFRVSFDVSPFLLHSKNSWGLSSCVVENLSIKGEIKDARLEEFDDVILLDSDSDKEDEMIFEIEMKVHQVYSLKQYKLYTSNLAKQLFEGSSDTTDVLIESKGQINPFSTKEKFFLNKIPFVLEFFPCGDGKTKSKYSQLYLWSYMINYLIETVYSLTVYVASEQKSIGTFETTDCLAKIAFNEFIRTDLAMSNNLRVAIQAKVLKVELKEEDPF